WQQKEQLIYLIICRTLHIKNLVRKRIIRLRHYKVKIMIDAHIHLEQYEDTILPVQIEKWQEAGVKGVIAVSNDLPSSYWTLELHEKFPGFIHTAIGFHP